jgi:hypothetical protein
MKSIGTLLAIVRHDPLARDMLPEVTHPDLDELLRHGLIEEVRAYRPTLKGLDVIEERFPGVTAASR